MHSMLITHSSDQASAFPSELLRFSTQVESSKTSVRSRGNSTTKVAESAQFAPALMPLQDRDLKAMSKLFERQDAEEIEADIDETLLKLYPEPCWEENFDFLIEYL